MRFAGNQVVSRGIRASRRLVGTGVATASPRSNDLIGAGTSSATSPVQSGFPLSLWEEKVLIVCDLTSTSTCHNQSE